MQCLALLLACAVISTVKSASADPLRYRGGMRNSPDSKRLNDKELLAVIKSLREKTGFSELGFDENGFLNLSDPNDFVGGSATARALIKLTAEARIAIDLESYNHSSAVAFARLSKPTIYQSRVTGASIDVYPIQIDFSDFSKLRGDKKVLEAFDVGFVIMHELGHAVLGLRDAQDEAEGPGECEEYINRIRRELNLPERQTYYARTRKSNFTTAQRPIEQAELVFAHSDDGKPRKFSLLWEAAMVGPIRPPFTLSIAKTKVVSALVNGQ
jgi:hypothetical protein